MPPRQTLDPLFFADGLNHAQTSELGRLSIGEGGLPLEARMQTNKLANSNEQSEHTPNPSEEFLLMLRQICLLKNLLALRSFSQHGEPKL